jgi:hypothetical protein
MRDVDYVMSRHPNSDGRRGSQGPDAPAMALGRSAVLLTYAAWEVYCEESLLEIAEWLASRPLDRLPAATRSFISDKAKSDPWVLEQGWSAALVELVKRETLGTGQEPNWGMNNANAAGVIKLQKAILGHAPLKDVRWAHASNDWALAKLERFVRLRGEIAHSGRQKSRLWAGDFNLDWRVFVEKLTEELDYAIRMWLTIQNDPDSDWWASVSAALADGEWHAGTELQATCGIVAQHRGGDKATYESFLEFMRRRVADGALELSGSTQRPLFRLPAMPDVEEAEAQRVSKRAAYRAKSPAAM